MSIARKIDRRLAQREPPFTLDELRPVVKESRVLSALARADALINAATKESRTARLARGLATKLRAADVPTRMTAAGWALATGMALHLALSLTQPYRFPSLVPLIVPGGLLVAGLLLIVAGRRQT